MKSIGTLQLKDGSVLVNAGALHSTDPKGVQVIVTGASIYDPPVMTLEQARALQNLITCAIAEVMAENAA